MYFKELTEQAEKDYKDRNSIFLGKNDFYVNKKNEIKVKNTSPVKYQKWQEPIFDIKIIDGEKYKRTIKKGQYVDVYEYAFQDADTFAHKFEFKLIGKKYTFKEFRGLLRYQESTNEHIDFLMMFFKFGCFDNKIKKIFSTKYDLNSFRHFEENIIHQYESKDKKINNIMVPILYSKYGWQNNLYYYISIMDFLNIDFNNIGGNFNGCRQNNSVKNIIDFFKEELSIDVKKNSLEKSILLLKSYLESKKCVDNLQAFSSNFFHKKKPKPKQKCYIMKDKNTGLYKIGKSNNPKNREKTLQAEKPTIKLIKTFNKDYELYLHEKYKEQRARGEWFNLSKLQVNYICRHYK
tara:strand:+ start:8511 stop:9557 length:1047 start_codon:yes stop_codon:yes gene_type:complete